MKKLQVTGFKDKGFVQVEASSSNVDIGTPTHYTGTPIQRFYAGSKILITGGTGFMGMVLVEKLLRSCPDILTIYIIVREKKQLSIEDRLANLFKDVLFEKLLIEQPQFTKKIVGIRGDCSEPKLGVRDEDIQTLIDEVNYVFHMAATVRFDELLQRATFINIRSIKDMLNICRKMKQLKFVTHVSTAYAYCTSDHREFTESFEEVPYTVDQMITLAENFSQDTIESMSKLFIDKYPNSYIFTKSISESKLRDYQDLPIAVFKPAIIVSTYREPLPGWINNYFGPQGVTTAAMLGLLRSLHCDEDVGSNIVPVDMSINALIAIPWQCRKKYLTVIAHNKTAAVEDQKKYEIPMYQYESETYNPINWKRFRYLTAKYGVLYPSVKVFAVYMLHLRKNIVSQTIAVLFLHHLPAFIVDGICILLGKKPMLREAYKKIHKFAGVISFFCNQQFTFKSSNMVELWEKMSPLDSTIFFSDLRKLDWDVFFRTYVLGCRIYLLKDPVERVPEGFKYWKRLKMYYGAGIFLIALLFFSLLYFFHSLLFA